MKQLHIKEWDRSNCLVEFNWALIHIKQKREIKDTGQRRKLST